jgi:hypothetical protein
LTRKRGIRLLDVSSIEEKNFDVSSELGGGEREELGGRYSGGSFGRNDERIESVLVGIGRDEEEFGDESRADA